ncbi:MAG: hypothetical protein N0C91_08115 [Candidatus Thiodiazotropha endolucinida]|nr:hypothetical protein [Candidatus Thiodiazotropha taylori]MCG8120898.1 hypothetical protein [Candidatus Thiodiazotropha taylori]MCW4287663.1 hypothetical protein [Candidatus Thiodiazotropha endolucinida]MCW4296589.1 hypothetical protein [Candidatus Thiodiazotropha endolucinida]
MNTLLCNLYLLNKADDRFWLSVPLSKNYFCKQPDRYISSCFTDRSFPAVVHALAKVELIEIHRGYLDRATGISRHTRIRATQRLLDLLEEEFGCCAYTVTERADAETVILRNSDKQLLGYDDTRYTNHARRCLNEIREAVSSSNFNLRITDSQEKLLKQRIFDDENKLPVDFNRTGLVRIFNNGRFDHGGRYYRHWVQNIPKEYRRHVVLNGKPTVEIDFSAMHPMMLYAQAGQLLPDDPYVLDGFDVPNARGLCKKIFNTMVNAETKQTALASVANDTLRGVSLPDRYRSPRLVMDALLEKHRPIAAFLNSNVGVELQHKDSEIAQAVMLKLLDYNIVSIPVHDSFLVQHGYGDVLLDTMSQVFEGHIGVSASARGSRPLFSVVENADTDIGPVSQCLRIDSIKNQQENASSPYLNYEKRNVEYYERMKA